MSKPKGQLALAMIGAGYAARLHCDAYEKVSGVELRLKTIVDPLSQRARQIQARYGFELATADFEQAVNDPEIDVIDICTPPVWHKPQIAAALRAGKHVICEKPLLGYFGQPGDPNPVGDEVDKAHMAQQVAADVAELRGLLAASGKKFCYAENYVYASAIQRAAELVRKKKTKLLLLKGEESLKGSQALAAGEWQEIGGGALIRAGVHPLSSLLLLKRQEAGDAAKVVSVTADMGRVTAGLSEFDHRHIACRPHDVEDYASLSLTFSDGSKAQVLASDLLLGGTRGFVELYGSDMVLMCRVSPTDPVYSFFPDEENTAEIQLSEMLPSPRGWNYPFVADETLRGFLGEAQDFVDCLLGAGQPQADFELAAETIQIVYAAYQSAAAGRRIDL